MRKNVASQKIAAHLVSKTDGSDVTSGTTNVYVTIDGGTQTAGGGTVTHEGNGEWGYAPTQAETNGNHLAFTFVNSSAVSATINVYTVSFDPHDTVRLGLTALPNAAAEAAGGLYTRGTGAGQINQDADGRIDVNTKAQNGTTLTARDIGASVLLSSGTGTGQVSLSSGAVTVGTNNDKTGYSLSQSFPSNFSSMSIDSSGRVQTTLTLRRNTAQNGGGLTTIKLDAGASSEHDYYNWNIVSILSGTGAGQSRLIGDYDGDTKLCQLDAAWIVEPDNTSVFEILAVCGDQGLRNTVVDLSTNYTATRAGYLDNLNVGGAVASQSSVDSVDTNVDAILEDTGTTLPASLSTIDGKLPALVGGRIDASVGAYQSGLTPLQPTAAGRTLDVTATGAARIDWANIENPTTSVNLSGTTVATVSNDVSVNAIGTDAITDDSISAAAVNKVQSGLATDANQTTILDRLGAFTGTGVNTVLGFLKSLMSKDASTPSDVGGTFDASTDSVEAIRDRGDAAWVTGEGGGGGGATAEEIVDALLDEVLEELGVGECPATPQVRQLLMLLYMALRNASEADQSKRTVRNNAGTAILEGAFTRPHRGLNQGKLGTPS